MVSQISNPPFSTPTFINSSAMLRIVANIRSSIISQRSHMPSNLLRLSTSLRSTPFPTGLLSIRICLRCIRQGRVLTLPISPGRQKQVRVLADLMMVASDFSNLEQTAALILCSMRLSKLNARSSSSSNSNSSYPSFIVPSSMAHMPQYAQPLQFTQAQAQAQAQTQAQAQAQTQAQTQAQAQSQNQSQSQSQNQSQNQSQSQSQVPVAVQPSMQAPMQMRAALQPSSQSASQLPYPPF